MANGESRRLWCFPSDIGVESMANKSRALYVDATNLWDTV